MEPEHADQHERPFFFSCPHCKEPIRFSVEAAPEEDDDFEDDDDILDDELDSLYYATMDEMTTAIRDGDYSKAIPLIHENFKHLLELPKELGEREELPPGIPVLDRGTRVLAATGGKDALRNMLQAIETIPALRSQWYRVVQQRILDADTCDEIVLAVDAHPGCEQPKVKTLINVVDGRGIATLIPYLENAKRIVRRREGNKILLDVPTEMREENARLRDRLARGAM